MSAEQTWPITWWVYTREYQKTEWGATPIMRNLETGEELPGDKLPYGACFDCNVNPETLEKTDYYPVGYDGKSIVCITPIDAAAKKPGSWWMIDSMASNCTMKLDKKHRCWVRHGSVGESLHVDKNGLTCAAGAGSIQHREWHGFLHNNKLSVNA